jgi:phosphohistidine phosphatase SixA
MEMTNMLSAKLRAAALGALVLVTPGAVSRSAGSADTVVLVVRHAEKAGPTGDVPLSEAGRARALALVPIGRAAGVSAIITTQFQRTRQTAAPLADALGITAEVANVQGTVPDHASAIAAMVKQRHAGQSVLVVGHSNTVPAIVHALGGSKRPDICDEIYDDLFTVIVAADGSARVVHGRYGTPTPAGPACASISAR